MTKRLLLTISLNQSQSPLLTLPLPSVALMQPSRLKKKRKRTCDLALLRQKKLDEE